MQPSLVLPSGDCLLPQAQAVTALSRFAGEPQHAHMLRFLTSGEEQSSMRCDTLATPRSHVSALVNAVMCLSTVGTPCHLGRVSAVLSPSFSRMCEPECASADIPATWSGRSQRRPAVGRHLAGAAGTPRYVRWPGEMHFWLSLSGEPCRCAFQAALA